MSKRVLRGLTYFLLVALVQIIGAQLALRWPSLHRTAQLSLLLVLTKLLADVLDRPFRPRRATFYYEDYFNEWIHYGFLGCIALGGHFIAARSVPGPLPTGWVALGVYAVWRLTAPRP